MVATGTLAAATAGAGTGGAVCATLRGLLRRGASSTGTRRDNVANSFVVA